MLTKILPALFHLSSRVAAQASRIGVYSDFVDLCRRKGVNSILDIGANRGQFATRIRLAGWRGQIYSFEPIDDLHRRLELAAKAYPNWTVAPRTALGDKPGKLNLNVASNDGKSSSLLDAEPDGPLYGSAFEYVRREEIDIITLDSWLYEVQPAEPLAIKIDVQGYELHVLRGAIAALRQTKVIMLETPLVSTYRGGASFDNLYQFMAEQNFRIANVHASTLDPRDGSALELDMTFVANA